jgi:hypothetical protein
MTADLLCIKEGRLYSTSMWQFLDWCVPEGHQVLLVGLVGLCRHAYEWWVAGLYGISVYCYN